MAQYSDSNIQTLISCAKVVCDPPKKTPRLVDADLRNEMVLNPVDASIGGDFHCFMRQCEDFPENFSVGMRFRPRDSRLEVTLLRYNGPHGPFNGANKGHLSDHPHWGFHIHSATEKAQDEGKKAEYYAKLSSTFGSFGEAINEIARNIGMNDTEIEKYFPIEKQMGLEF